jgi:trans-aconitate methyltransferase
LTRRYERAKHARTLRAIGAGPYESAVEIGCGIGILTERLAIFCSRVIAIDCVPAALSTARTRVSCPNVRFIEAIAPSGLPQGSHDLFLLSEVLYFLNREDIDLIASWIENCSKPTSRIVSVNWTGSTGHTLTGKAAADHLIASLRAWRHIRQIHKGYILDVLDAGASTKTCGSRS